MVWDGTTLSDTGVSNADSLLAANGGYSYTSENKLYHGTSLVRDFSGEDVYKRQCLYRLGGAQMPPSRCGR